MNTEMTAHRQKLEQDLKEIQLKKDARINFILQARETTKEYRQVIEDNLREIVFDFHKRFGIAIDISCNTTVEETMCGNVLGAQIKTTVWNPDDRE